MICYFEYDASIVSEFRNEICQLVLLDLPRDLGRFRLVRRLMHAFRKCDPGIIHIQYLSPGLLPILAARLSGIRIILATVHQPGNYYGLKEHFLIRCAQYLSSYFICVSRAAESSWFGSNCLFQPTISFLKNRKHFTLYNAVDTRRIDLALSADPTVLRPWVSLLKGKEIVGIVSRLSYEKGVDLAINAFAQVAKNNEKAHLLIVGDGTERQRLEALSARLGLTERITWTGLQSWSVAMRFLSIMDLVVCPSRFEGFGLTAVEAMSMGKLVIANNTTGLSEIILDHETGLLVDAGDVTLFAGKISQWLPSSVEKDRITSKARSEVKHLYTYQSFETNISILYKNLTAPRSKNEE
jgi:L-malate glycosyltransferase